MNGGIDSRSACVAVSQSRGNPPMTVFNLRADIMAREDTASESRLMPSEMVQMRQVFWTRIDIDRSVIINLNKKLLKISLKSQQL